MFFGFFFGGGEGGGGEGEGLKRVIVRFTTS